MTLDEIVLARRSIRNFTAEPVPEEAVQAMLEAGWQAPTAQHLPNCHFLYLEYTAVNLRLQRSN